MRPGTGSSSAKPRAATSGGPRYWSATRSGRRRFSNGWISGRPHDGMTGGDIAAPGRENGMSDLNAALAGGAPEEAAFLQGSIAHVRGREKWVLLVSMTAVFFVLLALYAAVLAVLLPNQIQALDPANKASEIGRAHVCTPVPNAHLVCRLL